VGRPVPTVGRVSAVEQRFRRAAWTYLGYGIVYWFTALYLQLAVFPVRGRTLFWFGAGAVIAVGVPWLLCRPRGWFERWVLSRRDFARLLALLVAIRAVMVARLALVGAESMRMPSFGGGVPPSPVGAWLMAAVAALTAAMLAHAAWSSEGAT
jgi:hypothetical protein